MLRRLFFAFGVYVLVSSSAIADDMRATQSLSIADDLILQERFTGAIWFADDAFRSAERPELKGLAAQREAHVYANVRMYTEAIGQYKVALQFLQEAHGPAHTLTLACVLEAADCYDDAVLPNEGLTLLVAFEQMLERARERIPDAMREKLVYFRICQGKGDWTPAEKQWLQTVREQAMAAVNQENKQDAIKRLSQEWRARTRRNKDITRELLECLRWIAKLKNATGRVDESFLLYDLFLKIASQCVDAVGDLQAETTLEYAEALRNAGLFSKAMAAANRTAGEKLADAPKQRLETLRIELQLDIGQLRPAFDLLRTNTRLQQQDVLALYQRLARSTVDTRDYALLNEVVKHGQTGVQPFDDKRAGAALLVEYCRGLLAQGKIQTALPILRSVTEQLQTPDDVAALYTQAYASARVGHAHLSRAMLNDADQAVGRYGDIAVIAFNLLATAHILAGQVDAALEPAAAGWEEQRRNLHCGFVEKPEEERLKVVRDYHKQRDFLVSLALAVPTSELALGSAVDAILRTEGLALDVYRWQREAVYIDTNHRAERYSDQLERQRRQLATFLIAGPDDDGERIAYESRVSQSRRRVRELESNLSKETATYCRKQAFELADVDALLRILPEKTIFIDYTRIAVRSFSSGVVNDRYVALVLAHGNTPRLVDLGAAEAIDRCVFAYRRAVATTGPAFRGLARLDDSGKQRVKQTGREMLDATTMSLYAHILAPLTNMLATADSLCICPDGMLNLIPFEALRSTPDAPFLVESSGISYVTAGRDLVRASHEQLEKFRRQSDAHRLSHAPVIPGVLSPVGMHAGATPGGRPHASRGSSYDDIRMQKLHANPHSPMMPRAPDISRPDGWDVIILGAPDYGTRPNQQWQFPGAVIDLGELRFTPLPGAKAEADLLRVACEPWAAAKQEHITHLTGSSASEGFLMQLESPRILHIATHGFYLPDVHDGGLNADPLAPLIRSGLAMAGANGWQYWNRQGCEYDGILTAYEAMSLRLWGTDLVVLSACETGIGEVANGESVFGMRRAFTAAGARALVTSLWKVPDAETVSFMKAFYQKWNSTSEKDDAITVAQRQLIAELRSQDRFAHPYYWAGFIFVGPQQ